jgi:hypothetical protein
MSTTINNASPVTRRVRAYFAPVDRVSGTPTLFDPAHDGRFAVDTPPAPWTDLGWCTGFTRTTGSKIETLRTGAPATTSNQLRTEVDATVALEFATWGKLQLALTAGSQQMNLLLPVAATAGATGSGSGGVAEPAMPLLSGSTAASLQLDSASAIFVVGGLLVVDIDYTGQVGYLGSGASGTYLRGAADAGNDLNFIRRMSLNVARIASIADGALHLEAPLLAGVPTAAMKVSRVAGFVDREGGTFSHEWSALFCIEGEQGDRVLYHYPRLQSMQGSTENSEPITGPLARLKLAGRFRALPIVDKNDGSTVVCFRSYLAH